MEHHLSIVDVKIVFMTSGIFFVSRQTKPFPDGSFLANRSAWGHFQQTCLWQLIQKARPFHESIFYDLAFWKSCHKVDETDVNLIAEGADEDGEGCDLVAAVQDLCEVRR